MFLMVTFEVCSLILQQNKDVDFEGFTMQMLMTTELICQPDPDERALWCLIYGPFKIFFKRNI